MVCSSRRYKGISLFTGAGGMDIGFEEAGVDVLWANELVPAAADTFIVNHPDVETVVGDICQHYGDLPPADEVDIVFGGPPCQGFSVAGKMDPSDPRSQMIFAFLDVIEKCQPTAFVMENVKALGVLGKWSEVREKYHAKVKELGYTCFPYVCRATDFGVPQKRERVFFVGIKGDHDFNDIFQSFLDAKKAPAPIIKDVLEDLGPAGTDRNPITCSAKITYAKNPVIRDTPWAGMYFNGAGRPIDIDGYANTLPASMGGNKTPIVDEEYLHGSADQNWMTGFHERVVAGDRTYLGTNVPARMRRITIKEAARIQSFPDDYIWMGANSAVYKQIGNAVPAKLAEAVATSLISTLEELGIAPASES